MSRVPTTAMMIAMHGLERDLSSNAPAWAVDQLTKGWDTPHLRQLAGLTRYENRFELEEMFRRALHELGGPMLERPLAVAVYARELMREYLDGVTTQNFLLRELCQLCIADGHPSDLSPFYNLCYALDDLKEQGWSFYDEKATPENFDALVNSTIGNYLSEHSSL